MDPVLKSLFRILLRDTLAVALVVGVFVLMYCDVRFIGHIGDNGFVEDAQAILCTASAALFFVASRRETPCRRVLELLSLVLFAMAVRELDAVADKLFHGAWRVFVIPFVTLFFWQLCRHWWEACRSILELLSTPTGRHLELATLALLVFSRLVGTKGIWNLLIADEWLGRAAKNAIEEGTELFGYMLFFLAALETLRLTRSDRAAG